MIDNLYIVKVGKVYLSHDFDRIGKYSLCANPTKEIKMYTDEATAGYIADKLGGEVMTFKEVSE